MKNTKLANKYVYRVLIVVFLFMIKNLFSQPLRPPSAFEDDYHGYPDSVMMFAKVKIHKTYYQPSDDTVKSLYNIQEFNRQGRLVSQKWYNFISHKEMYTANYEYDQSGFFISCSEKITRELDDFDIDSKKKDESGYFVGGTPENPTGEVIPMNDKGEFIVKTFYKKDSLGGYLAKKYFYDSSFYKQKVCPYWNYNQQFYFGIYINKDKNVDIQYSDVYFKADTLGISDTLDISIKFRSNNKECCKILKRKYNLTNTFEICEFDLVLNSVKIYFSPWRGGMYNITYISTSDMQNKLLLEHRFEISDDTLNEKIQLMEIENLNKLLGMYGGLFYTEFREGYLYKEEQYLVNHGIRKMLEKNYGKYNLPNRIIAYQPHYDNVFGPYCNSFRTYALQSIEEIHEFEYFD